MKKNLVIISVPVVRIARSSLCKIVLDLLRERGDVVIVSPWSDQNEFIENFSAKNIFFIKWEKVKISKYKKKILDISEIVRFGGYWRKFKDQGMIWYFKNQYTDFQESGKDIKASYFKSFIYWTLSILGLRRSFWRIVENFAGKHWYQFPDLIEMTEGYENVTLIQSANWGIQDRALSRLSTGRNWRKVLLPYTTDQLYCNGYLLNTYDAVCVQGDFELKHAKNLHLVSEESIYRLGSTWFRHLEELQKDICQKNHDINAPRTILYAGMGEKYFSRQSEFLVLDALIKFIDDANEDLRLVYRPIPSNDDDRNYIKERFGNLLELQWPDASVIGLDHYQGIKQEESLIEYIYNLLACDLLVMSYNTTIAMDAAFLGNCGIISNMIDPDGRLERRLYSIHNGACPAPETAENIDSLIKSVEFLLDNTDKAMEASKKMISKWDYPDAEFASILTQAIFEKDI